ncbi:maleylpyruvate isomerase family mycothiol-dependent enzyme [Promicromonospora thailandica]|uniref:TIGR03083 family protein n=1 Tax=Promicromonospora thailandica TaxID=765201 RepID=A0A9X2G8C0_9MICO|nr:maleylpyruvate isomerase family mycothiol-dependent enzyme [Promicromonospora thailandica]MCP2267237.1 TIGR03083 family protein [Promicromonospora thailandica]BFF17455.1 maleylpyruvate isomerase family mycothiol-dependent enzyme [Promicromonospora thailandica]
MPELTPDSARRAILEHTRRLAGSAAAAGPQAPVPTAPAWTVADLVAHVGQTQHWTAEIMERRVTDFADLPTQTPDAPADPDRWAPWLEESAQRVVSAFADDALAAPVLNAAGDDRPGARFWLFNVLNEAVVHGTDGARAAGRDAAVEPDVATALIGHHLAMLTSPTWSVARPESAGAIRGTGQTLQWQSTDTADAWFVERQRDGATWRPGTGPADVTVTGPAAALLLTLVRRLPFDDGGTGLRVEGDAALVRHWLDNTAHVAD